MLSRPDKLTLATGELWPSKRPLLADGTEESDPIPGEAVMESLEHLGQYVFEMTKAKVDQMRAERGLPAAQTAEVLEPLNEEQEMNYGQPAADGDAEEDVELKDGTAVGDGI